MSSDSFLEFPFDINEFRESDQVLQYIYVRNSYFDIFNLICESITSGTKRFVVTGTPGIGKSTFMYYFIWRFLNDAEGSLDQNRFNLYIQCAPDEVLQFKSGRVLELSGMEARRTLKRDKKALVLVDMREPDEPMLCPGIRIVLSSPNPARFKEFSKGVCLILYMNPWIYDEILTVWEKLYKDVLSLDEVNEAYRISGGIVRYVLEQNKKAQIVMDKAFSALGGGGVTSLSEYIGSNMANDDKVTYKILHYSSSDYTEENAKLVFSSGYASSRLFNDLQKGDAVKAIKFMNNNKLGYLQASVGVIFERLAHVLVCSDGISHIRRLRSADADVHEESEYMPRKLNFIPKYPIKFSSLSSGTAYSKGQYFEPYSGTFKSIDSFSVIGADVFAFQFTVGKSHPIKGEGLEDLVNFVEEKFPSEVSSLRYHLVFISPKGKPSTQNFKMQPITYKNQTDCFPKKLVPFTVNQWIVELEILDSISKKFLP